MMAWFIKGNKSWLWQNDCYFENCQIGGLNEKARLVINVTSSESLVPHTKVEINNNIFSKNSEDICPHSCEQGKHNC
jgi:hypothetical protein